jgi:hypothetical protein
MQHEEKISPVTIFLIETMARRKVLKAEAFRCRDNNDPIGNLRNKLGEKNEKIKINAFYGAMGETRSFQYNPSAVSSVTAQGRSIISTTMWFYEAFLGNNIVFNIPDDLFHYISLILEEPIHQDLYTFIDYEPEIEEIVSYYMYHYESTKDARIVAAIIRLMIKNATKEQRIKLYFKNNLYALLEKNPKIMDIVIKDIVSVDASYYNAYVIPDKIKNPMETLLAITHEFIFVKDYITYDKYRKYITHTRKAILYSDTDSVFVYAGEWLFKIIQYINGVALQDIKITKIPKEFALSTINIIIYLGSVGIAEVYDALLTNVNVAPEYRKYINIKNEFLMDMYITLPMKKNYVYRAIVNEGKILNKPTFETVGGNLNPKAKNTEITNMIRNIVKEVSVDCDKIQPALLIRRIYELREKIITSLEKGESKYLLPTNIKSPDAYNDPYSLYTVRAVEAYRLISGDDDIVLPNIFNIIDIHHITGPKDIECIKDTFPTEYNNILTKIFKHPHLKTGLTYIAIPPRLEEIPEWIMVFIDINSIWRKYLNPLIAFCPAIGIKIDTIKSQNYYSTILDI